MPMTTRELASILLRDLSGASCVWLDGKLDPSLSALIDAGAHRVAEVTGADAVVVAADRVANDGSVLVGRAVSGPRVVAVLPLSLADDEARIVHKPAPGPRAHVSRVYSPLCVLEPCREGLVIVELAKGVSAADVQTVAEPTLLISATVKEMRGEMGVDEVPSEG